MYLDAMEANFSHEQMTPLNSILGNSQFVYKRNKILYTEYEKELERQGKTDELEAMKKENK